MSAGFLNIDVVKTDSAIRGGQPIIADTSLRVIDVVAYYLHAGLTPEDLAIAFQLSLGQVHASLAHYFLNKERLDADMRNNAELAEQEMQKAAKQGRLVRFE